MDTTDLLNYIESVAPLDYAEKWDQSGIQIAGSREEIKCLAIGLDATLSTIQQALAWDADFILTHHPLTLSPQLPKNRDEYQTVLKEVLNSGAWLYSAHTSLDVQTKGPVSWLAKVLELKSLSPIQPIDIKPLLQVRLPLEYMVPDLFQDLTNLFSESRQPQDPCLSKGYFICDPESIPNIIGIFRKYLLQDYLEIRPASSRNKQCGFGIIGDIDSGLTKDAFLEVLCPYLETDHITFVGQWPQYISRVAYCPGSGMSLAKTAFNQGADIFISGDLKYHQAQEIESHGLTIDAGHFILEEKMMRNWAGDIEDRFYGQDMEIKFFQGHNPFRIQELR